LIHFINTEKSDPYKYIQKYYYQALEANQKNIEAISISSLNKTLNEVNSRYVNLKYVKEDRWFFYTNYNSPKAFEFENHNQVSCIIFWNNINIQIRIKALIEKANDSESDNYFLNRSIKKNALAISSNQSKKISSYKKVEDNYKNTLEKINQKGLIGRPKSWGGYFLVPYYFEFWKGEENRLNQRVEYIRKKNEWKRSFLQP
jgi:NAD(P)H-hydrate epimerase